MLTLTALVFVYSVEGVGPRNVHPIKTLILSILIDFPTCLSTCICIPLRTWSAQTGYVISAFTYTIHIQSENGRQTSTNRSSFLVSQYFYQLCYNVFSPVNDMWCIVIVLSLVVWSVCIHVFRGRGFGQRLQGGTFAFSAIRLKLAFSKISYCTFNI